MTIDQMALLIPLIAVSGAFVVAIFFVLSNAATQVLCHWKDASLKIRLVESGMSADEIERIVAASSTKTTRRDRRVARTNASQTPPVNSEIKAKPIPGASY